MAAKQGLPAAANMLGTLQLPEVLLCHPAIQWKGKLCSSADRFMRIHHLLLHEVNMPPLQLHICTTNQISAANRKKQQKRTEKFTIVSDHNGSLPEELQIFHPREATQVLTQWLRVHGADAGMFIRFSLWHVRACEVM